MVASAFGFSACNDDSDSDNEIWDNSAEYAVMVQTFSLQANDSILANLDSVFFSIDLNAGLVFNADSLPLGTRVDSLGVSMTFSAVSKAEITMPGSNGQDTVINYLENAGHAIDFSRGFVNLHLESSNAETKRDYRIYVNVHKMKPDSLAWGNTAFTQFPTSIAAPTAINAVDFKGSPVCFATSATDATRATATDADLSQWSTESITLPAGFDITSIVATEEALFGVDNASNLYTSTDGGSTWSATGTSMTYIYGAEGNVLLGNLRGADGKYSFVTYPASTVTPVPADAPVSATSQSVSFTTQWSTTPQTIILSGLKADGTPTGNTWIHDNGSWEQLSANAPVEASGMTMLPYFSIRVRTNWVADKRTALIAFGGTKADGTISRDLFISVDRGFHWTKAGELMQLPANFPTLTGARALVYPMTITSRSAISAWQSVETPVIPSWFVKAADAGIAPITSWECPYIYIFGGTNLTGEINTAIWRGAINRLTFKPLQ